MTARLLEILKLVAVHTLLIAAFLGTAVPGARGEPLVLFQDPTPGAMADNAALAARKNTILKFNEKGNLLIQCGGTRFTLSYTPPVDRFKPTEQRNTPQHDMAAAINGISLTASLNF